MGAACPVAAIRGTARTRTATDGAAGRARGTAPAVVAPDTGRRRDGNPGAGRGRGRATAPGPATAWGRATARPVKVGSYVHSFAITGHPYPRPARSWRAVPRRGEPRRSPGRGEPLGPGEPGGPALGRDDQGHLPRRLVDHLVAEHGGAAPLHGGVVLVRLEDQLGVVVVVLRRGEHLVA